VTEDETESTESPVGGVTIIHKTPVKDAASLNLSFSLTLLEQDNRFPVLRYLAQKIEDDEDIIITDRTER
jgi:hypothetical protein